MEGRGGGGSKKTLYFILKLCRYRNSSILKFENSDLGSVHVE